MNLAPRSHHKVLIAVQSKPVFEFQLEPDFWVRLCALWNLFNRTVLRLDQWLCSEQLSSVFSTVTLRNVWVVFVKPELDIFVHLPFVNFSFFVRQVVTASMPAKAYHVSDFAWKFSLSQLVVDLFYKIKQEVLLCVYLPAK
jgi:hypothetical protein